MAKRRLAVLLFALSVAIILPTITYAAASNGASGIVPCGNGYTVDEATNCQACNIVQLIQNLVMFMIGLSIPVAVAMFSWAGVLYFTSATNPHNIDRAKSIFGSALFGFVLAVSGWLIINTLLYSILNDDYKKDSSWFHIQCTARTMNTNIGDVLDSVLGSVPPPPPPATSFAGYAPVLSCDGSKGFILIDSTHCKNPDTGEVARPEITVPAPIGGGTLSEAGMTSALQGTYQYQQQLAQYCAQYGLANCRVAQAVMAIESNGRAGVVSGAGCVGLMQICPGTAQTLDPARFGNMTYAQITAALKDPATNMQLGVQYLASLSNTFGDSTANTIAAYNGGAGANNNSATCVGMTYWACTANEGYAETRNYVPNVINTMSHIR